MAADLWGRRSFEFIHKLAVGKSGGILVAWDAKVMEVINHLIGAFLVSILGRNKEDEKLWAFSSVYGSCDQGHQAEFGLLWVELSNIRSDWDVPWCVGGDLNVIWYPGERLGASTMTRHMQQFNEFIQELDLVDLPLQGATFTWTNN